MEASAINAELVNDSVMLYLDDGSHYELPNLWLRDNCPCDDCRVVQTQEKRFMLSSVPVDLKPKSVDVNAKTIHLFWPDDHETNIRFKDIEHLQHKLSLIHI